MTKKKRPTAFVAMKFDSDHWRDKRYAVIREELQNAGFDCIRADEVRTSGPVDSSGDSHSVSYEIGFCHGVMRSPEATLLLKSGADLPFNYRHFRHRVYRDIRHLRRLVRDYLSISEPFGDDQFGYTFTFDHGPESYGYILKVAFAVFDVLRDYKFTGRCECYGGDQVTIPGSFFSLGVMIRGVGKRKRPTYDWWKKIEKRVASEMASSSAITHQEDMSELAEKRAMRAHLIHVGAAEFDSGEVKRVLGENDECFFTKYLARPN